MWWSWWVEYVVIGGLHEKMCLTAGWSAVCVSEVRLWVCLAGWSAVWQRAACCCRLPHVGHDVDNSWQVCAVVSDGDDPQPGESSRDTRLLGTQLRAANVEADPGGGPTGAHAQVRKAMVWCLSICQSVCPNSGPLTLMLTPVEVRQVLTLRCVKPRPGVCLFVYCCCTLVCKFLSDVYCVSILSLRNLQQWL